MWQRQACCVICPKTGTGTYPKQECSHPPFPEHHTHLGQVEDVAEAGVPGVELPQLVALAAAAFDPHHSLTHSPTHSSRVGSPPGPRTALYCTACNMLLQTHDVFPIYCDLCVGLPVWLINVLESMRMDAKFACVVMCQNRHPPPQPQLQRERHAHHHTPVAQRILPGNSTDPSAAPFMLTHHLVTTLCHN